MSDDATAEIERLTRFIVSAVRSEAVLYTDAPADLVKKLVVARINAIKDLQLLSEDEAALLVSSLAPSPGTHVAPPPLLTPDGSPSPCGVLYSLIHRPSPQSTPGTPDDITISIPDSVGMSVAGAMAGALWGGSGIAAGAAIGSVLGSLPI
jgi:hypothetical protein